MSLLVFNFYFIANVYINKIWYDNMTGLQEWMKYISLSDMQHNKHNIVYNKQYKIKQKKMIHWAFILWASNPNANKKKWFCSLVKEKA